MPEISYLEAIRQALWQEMKRDERVFLLGEDIGRYGGAFGLTHGMLDEFGEERVRETPRGRPPGWPRRARCPARTAWAR